MQPEIDPSRALHVIRAVGEGRKAPTPQQCAAIQTERQVMGSAADRALAGPRDLFCSTGHWLLDDFTGGIEPGMNWLVAAKSGWGKSTFCSAIADQNLGRRRVLIGSTEDVSRIYGARILCRRTRVNAKRFKRGTLWTVEQDKVRGAVDEARELPLFVDWNGVCAEDIEAQIRELVPAHGIELVLLDWLGKVPSRKRCDDPRERVTRAFDCASRGAKQAGAAFVAFSQVTPKQGQPDASWIRDSQDVAHNADVIVFGIAKDELDDNGGLLHRDRKLLVFKVKDDEAGQVIGETGWHNESASFQPVVKPTRELPPDEPDYSEEPETRGLFDFPETHEPEPDTDPRYP